MKERPTFPREARIRRHGEFQRAQRAPDLRVPEKAFLLLARVVAPEERPPTTAEEPATCRLGLVASRKLGGAVERNRGKRIMREVFRRWRSRLPSDLDVVVILHPSILTHTATSLANDFARAAARLGRERERLAKKRAAAPREPDAT